MSADKLRARWNSIRSSFARELRAEKQSSKSGSGKRKRAVYKYARNLAFLRPHMRLKSLTENYNASTTEEVYIAYYVLNNTSIYDNQCITFNCYVT